MQNAKSVRDIGDFDRYIQIYAVTETDTDYSYRETTTLVESVFAQELPKTRMMNESIEGGKESAMQEIHWRVRKEVTATVGHMIWYDSQWYDIITINPEARDYKILVSQLRHDAQWPSP